ncbi:MAG: DEAD/DEAH box helicase [Phycisphaerales bacterium]|nr:DEAD/DEAH box helicase [Phycisphaerales bacterium]
MSRNAPIPSIPSPLLTTLERLGFANPTEIQALMREPVLCGRDVLALAPTGTGKTLGFGVPVMASLLNAPPKTRRGAGGARYVESCERLRAIIVSPTRELAQQVASDLAAVAKGSLLRIGAVYGKSPTAPQRDLIRSGLDILVGTPGRLREFLDEGSLTFASARIFVIDEADRMVDMGFLPQIEQLLSMMPAPRQVICLSATLPVPIESRVLALLRDPARAQVGIRNAPINRLNARFEVEDGDKVALLIALIRQKHLKGVVVYVRTRRRAGWVAAALRRHEISVSLLHGDRSQKCRNEALEAFAERKVDVMVATDVAARGLHVPRIRTVVNYDVPLMPEDFVHRIGRAGHGGGAAESFTFVDSLEASAWARVSELVGEVIPSHKAPEFAQFTKKSFVSQLIPAALDSKKGNAGANTERAGSAFSPKPTEKPAAKSKSIRTPKRPIFERESFTGKKRLKRERSTPIARDIHRGGGVRKSKPDSTA